MMYRMQHRAAPLGSPVIALRRTLVGLGASTPPQILDGDCKLHCFQGPVQTAPTATLQQTGLLTGSAPMASTSTSTATSIPDQCGAYLYQWAVANPQRAQCMTEPDMKAALAVCVAMFSGQIDNDAGLREFDVIVAGACKRKGESTNERTRGQCTDEVHAFIMMLPPAQRGCLENSDREQLIELCDLTYNYGLMPATAMVKASEIVAAACERAGDIPQAEPPVMAPPPVTAAPPPAIPPVEHEAQQEIYGQVPPNSGFVVPNGTPANGGGERLAPPVTQTARGPIRRWGPVVGVLVLLGGAVYVIRKQAAA